MASSLEPPVRSLGSAKGQSAASPRSRSRGQSQDQICRRQGVLCLPRGCLPPLDHTGLSLSVPSSFRLNCDPEAASCLVQVHFLSTAHKGHTPVGLVPPTLSGFLAQSQSQILSLIASHELQVLVQKAWKGTCKGYLWAFALLQSRGKAKEVWVDRDKGQGQQNLGC